MNCFNLLINLRFSECLSEISENIKSIISTEELSRELIIASIALMEEGSENVQGRRPGWITHSLEKLEKQKIKKGIYFPILLSFEAARLFAADDSAPAGLLFARSLEISNSASSKACIYFAKGIFILNHYRDACLALHHIEKSISNFTNNDSDRLFLYFHFWSKSMRCFALSKLERYNEAITDSRDLIHEINENSFLPLLENCYLNLADAYGGLGDFKESLYYLNANLNLWAMGNNEKRMAVGLTQAAVIAISLNELESAEIFLERRKATWIPFESHWNIISNAYLEKGHRDKAKNWNWRQ